MEIYLATDHAGFELKEAIKQHLMDNNYDVHDLGAHEYNESDDYPDFISLAAKAVSEDPENRKAIVLGGSGTGEAIVANKYDHVRCALYNGSNLETIKLSREHNNANALSLGARFIDRALAIEAVNVWLSTPFSGDERHIRRIEKIDKLVK